MFSFIYLEKMQTAYMVKKWKKKNVIAAPCLCKNLIKYKQLLEFILGMWDSIVYDENFLSIRIHTELIIRLE